jgi:hypothetical protein
MGHEPVARPLPAHRTHQTSMPEVGLEPTNTSSERSKTVHVLDRLATVTGVNSISKHKSKLSLIKDLGVLDVTANFVPQLLIQEQKATCH